MAEEEGFLFELGVLVNAGMQECRFCGQCQ